MAGARGDGWIAARAGSRAMVVGALVAMLATPEPGRAQGDFVRVEGTSFVLSGEPFAFVGANVAAMHGPGHRAAAEATLDAVADDGARVVRIWALGEWPLDAPAWADDYAFSRGEGRVVASSFRHLDRLLAACRARGLLAIVVLANRWSDYGGIPEYLRWAGVPFELDENGALPELMLPAFFADARARSLYLAHVERVVGRTNELTGVAYRDDATIFAWELFNEISAPPRARAALVALLEDAAAHVRAVDANHLVSAGHIGYELARDRRTWEAAVAARGIDYADAHAYPTAYGRVRDLAALDRWIEDRAFVARRLNRPLVFGEVGFTATAPRVFGHARAAFLDRFFRVARRHGVAGVLPWIYASATDAPREHTLLVDGDVERTLDLRRVIRRHARRFHARARTVVAPRERSLYRTVTGAGRPHDRWSETDSGALLRIPYDRFLRARFEEVGRASGPRSAHVYGMGTGHVRYRFALSRPARRLLRLGAGVTVLLRASSELPGIGTGATEADTSEVVVRIDGLEVGRARLSVDDGLGAALSLASSDAELTTRMSRGEAHTLELAIEEPDAPGLCVYGPADDPGALADVRIEIAL